ncbi:MAG: NAD(P)H-dependent oxidoreductase [Flavobacteriaceae bacterium]
MNIYVLLAHPDKESFNGQLAEAYFSAAKEKGHEVRIQRLGEMKFDPILWKGYKEKQELEPDLVQAQENILWCEKWVIVYPIWWGSVPALFKGFLDRTLYSGFAYKYHDNDPMWDKLLKGRTGELITTCDAPNWWIWWQYRNSDLNAVKRATLEFCGIKPVKVTRISRVKYLDENQRIKWIDRLVKRIK